MYNSFLIIEITGNPNVGFNEEDIEGDFDPKKYDKAMQVLLKQRKVKIKIVIKILSFTIQTKATFSHTQSIRCVKNQAYSNQIFFNGHSLHNMRSCILLVQKFRCFICHIYVSKCQEKKWQLDLEIF